jgi:hypothetical protein
VAYEPSLAAASAGPDLPWPEADRRLDDAALPPAPPAAAPVPLPAPLAASAVPAAAVTPELRLEPATLCLDIDDYCDRLELSVSGTEVHGTWSEVTGFFCPLPKLEAAVSGTVEEGRVLLRCNALTDPCPEGYTYAWIIDRPFDGTLDMYQLDGLWGAWFDELEYTVIPGPCPGPWGVRPAPAPTRSTQPAGRR